MNTNTRGRTQVGHIAWMVLLALQLAALGITHAAGSGADAETPASTPASGPTPAGKGDQLAEVVVTGIKANLEKSLDVKMNAPIVLDSINSTELGRFPLDNVADALGLLPGVTITRTTGGEGQGVFIRGFGPQYNIITLNNRILASDDDGRDLAFDVLPAEVITGADVLKSAQASTVEGSIGGTVNLRTTSPFDNPGLHAGVRGERDYNQMTELYGSKYSAYLEDTNAAKTLGFLLGGVDSNVNVRTDSLNAYNQTLPTSAGGNGPSTYPFSGGPGAVPLTASPCCITFGSIFDDKKRSALNGLLEWRPSEKLKVTADYLWTHLNDPQIGYNESYYFPAGSDGTPWRPNATVQNGVVTGLTSDLFQPEMVNNTIDRQVNTYLYGLNVSWKPLARLTVDLDAYQSKANRPEGGNDTFVTAGLVSSTPNPPDTLYFQDLPYSLPSINVVVPPSQLGLTKCPPGTASTTDPRGCSYTALMNSGFLNNNKYWSTHYVGLNGYSVHDKIDGFSLDSAWDMDRGPFQRLLFGSQHTQRDKSRLDSSNDWNNGSGQYGTLYTTAGCPVQCNPYSFASQGFNVISMLNLPNFMHDAGGSYPTTLPALNAGQLEAFLKSLDGKPNPNAPIFNAAGTAIVGYAPFNYASTQPQVNPFNSYDVTEKTTSIYVEADFAAKRWSGNAGVRVVRTETSASTATTVPVAVWCAPAACPSQTTAPTYTVLYATSQPLSDNGQYTLALPSGNLAYWAIPDKLQVRLAAAGTMSRPNLNELAPTSTNTAINGAPASLTYSGTAGLKPVRANQADLSIEWYYAPHDALTAAVFAKDVRDDIYSAVANGVNLGTLRYDGGPPGTVPAQPFPWTVSAPANGTRSTVSGVEFIWQHILPSGFGTHMQYTATRTRSYDQNGVFVGAINAAPPTTWAIGVLFDNGKLSADVNWDHQSGYTYCSTCTEITGWPAVSDAFDWVTASVHYKLTEGRLRGLEIYAEGKNLSNSIVHTYLNSNPLLPWGPGQLTGESTSGVGVGYSAYGRTYILGLAYTF
jgi:TonB-dependent receptor